MLLGEAEDDAECQKNIQNELKGTNQVNNWNSNAMTFKNSDKLGWKVVNAGNQQQVRGHFGEEDGEVEIRSLVERLYVQEVHVAWVH